MNPVRVLGNPDNHLMTETTVGTSHTTINTNQKGL